VAPWGGAPHTLKNPVIEEQKRVVSVKGRVLKGEEILQNKFRKWKVECKNVVRRRESVKEYGQKKSV